MGAAIKALRRGSRGGDAGGVGDHSGRSEDPAGQEESGDALGVLGRGARRSRASEVRARLASLRRASPCPDRGEVIRVGGGSVRSSSVGKSGPESSALRNAGLHKREQGGGQGSQRGGGDAGRGACPSVPRGAQRPLEGGQGSDLTV